MGHEKRNPMKYPIGIQSFEQIIEDGYVYIDKTALIYDLVDNGKIYFLSRPRRFGKSLLVSTLENYFLGRKDLFKGLSIDKLETKWTTYPVFHLDFNGLNFTKVETLEVALHQFLEENEKKYNIVPKTAEIGLRFNDIIIAAHAQTGHRAVVLIDEYDKPLLDVMNTGIASPTIAGEIRTLEDYNREILKGFYSVFKLADKHLQFVLLTGVTKFSQISVFSGFNQPRDISSVSRYDALCGITREELLDTFAEQIKQLGQSHDMSEAETITRLTRQYDGYHFSDGLTGIFNPFSILSCMANNKFGDYWFSTGTPTYLMRLMSDSHVNINELAGKEYEASEFVDYKATEQKPLPMLYQSGYLTIKSYDREYGVYRLDFPNEEVRNGMATLLASEYINSDNASESWVLDITRALRRGETDKFRNQLTALLSGISYRFQRKQDERECERHFQYTFYLIMLMLGKYNLYVEKETSRGRIDCILECPNYVYIFEFKLNSTAAAALRQIEERGYADPYTTDTRPIYKVGISFSSETGTINDFDVIR